MSGSRRRFCFLAVVVAVGVANILRAEIEEDDDEDALLLLAFLEFREQRELLEDAPPAAEKEDGEEMARHDKLDDIFSFFSSL